MSLRVASNVSMSEGMILAPTTDRSGRLFTSSPSRAKTTPFVVTVGSDIPEAVEGDREGSCAHATSMQTAGAARTDAGNAPIQPQRGDFMEPRWSARPCR